MTVGGHDYEVGADALNDFELLDELREAQRENATVMPSLLRRLIGETQYRQAMERLRDKATGRVSLEAGIAFVGAVFEALDPNS